MANLYQIKNTTGDKTITIQPLNINGSLESAADSDVNLIGQGTSQWGADFNESLYHIVENFACPEKAGTPGVPQDETDLGAGLGINNPIAGQAWFNTTTGKLLIFNAAGSPPANEFQTINGITVGTAPPTAPFVGDLWYDTSVPQLKVYNGAAFDSTADRYLLLDGSVPMTGTLHIGDGVSGRSLIIKQAGSSDPNIKFRNTSDIFTSQFVDDLVAKTLIIEKLHDVTSAPLTTLTFHTDGNVSLTGGSNVPTDNAHLTRRDFVFNTFVELGGDVMNGDLTFNTGRLLANIGTVALPGITFSGDTNTGIYQTATNANQISFSVAGTNRFNIEIDGTLNVAGTANYETLIDTDTDIPNKKYVDDEIIAASSATVPIGTITMFAGVSAPTGYAFCDGGSVFTVGIYADLFALIGYTYGGSGGSFNLPDFRGRLPGGVGTTSPVPSHGSGSLSLAQKLGQWYSRLTSTSQMPNHAHGSGNHKHTYIQAYDSGPTTGANDQNSRFTSFTSANTGYSGNIIAAEGSSANINTYPPILGINFIIKY